MSNIIDTFPKGTGYPSGGTTGQALVKKTNADNDVEWGSVQAPLTGSDGIDITSDIVSLDPMPASDMSEIVTPLPGTMSRRHKYSTEEQIVGEWIDGKPIYEIVIEDTMPSYTSGTIATKLVNPPSGVDKVLDITVMMYALANKNTRKLPNSGSDSTATSIQISADTYIGSTGEIVLRSCNSSHNGKNVIIFLRYTKV